jgi:O-antigen ligase
LKSQSTLFDLRTGLRPLGALLSFEAIFVLFLASVSYKADPRFSFVPIDLTLIFLVVGITMGLAIVWREGIYLPGLTVVSLFIVFIIWAMITHTWTPSKIYAPRKLLELVMLNLWCLIATALLIANRRERVRRFLLLLLVFGTAAALDGIVRYATADQFAFSSSFSLENYIAHGRFYGLGAVVAFAAWLQTRPFSKRGVALTAALTIYCCGLLVSGGRGPILGTLAGMMLPLALGFRFADRRLLASKALVASVLLFVLTAVVLLQASAEFAGNLRALQRFNTLFTEVEGGQSQRLDFWKASWHLWLEQPLLGSGIGSWPMRYHGLDLGRYPHNLILEVLVEFGLIGLLLLAGVAVAATRAMSVRRLREDPVLMCIAMLCITTFVAAMTSSDITGNRNVFAMLGLLVMRPHIGTSRVQSETRARDQRRSILPHRVPNPSGAGVSPQTRRAARAP